MPPSSGPGRAAGRPRHANRGMAAPDDPKGRTHADNYCRHVCATRDLLTRAAVGLLPSGFSDEDMVGDGVPGVVNAGEEQQ